MDDQTLPPQHQDQRPGREGDMTPRPVYFSETYKPAAKLKGKVAIVTGADSGIGRAVAIYYAKEGANVVLVYLEEHEDAKLTMQEVEKTGVHTLLYAGDIADHEQCERVVSDTIQKFGRLDIVVNNAGEQHPQSSLEDISDEQWDRTFQTNIVAMFRLTKAALPHMKKGACDDSSYMTGQVLHINGGSIING